MILTTSFVILTTSFVTLTKEDAKIFNKEVLFGDS
jgi:hypothetical protein